MCLLSPSLANLKHILIGRETSLTQGSTTNRTAIGTLLASSLFTPARAFVSEGVKPTAAQTSTTSDLGQLCGKTTTRLLKDEGIRGQAQCLRALMAWHHMGIKVASVVQKGTSGTPGAVNEPSGSLMGLTQVRLLTRTMAPTWKPYGCLQ